MFIYKHTFAYAHANAHATFINNSHLINCNCYYKILLYKLNNGLNKPQNTPLNMLPI